MMKWGKLKDFLCYLCPPGTEVDYWFLTEEIAGSNAVIPFLELCVFFTEFAEFSENIKGTSNKFLNSM